MAAIVGTTGVVSFGGDATSAPNDFETGGANGEHALLAHRWTLNLVSELHDVTPFHASDNFRKSIRGQYKATGTVEGFLDDTAAHDVAVYQTPTIPSDFVLTVGQFITTDHTYAFKGLITGFNVTSSPTEPNRFTATYESTGDITVTSGVT